MVFLCLVALHSRASALCWLSLSTEREDEEVGCRETMSNTQPQQRHSAHHNTKTGRVISHQHFGKKKKRDRAGDDLSLIPKCVSSPNHIHTFGPRAGSQATTQILCVCVWLSSSRDSSFRCSDLMHMEQPTELKHITQWRKCKQLRLLQ